MTTSFYNKYRPQTMDQLVGQGHIKQVLNNSIRLDRVHHSYLFSGSKGVGKTTMARILSRMINCTGDVKPCLDCPSCQNISKGSSKDVVELDAASNRGVQEVEAIISDTRFLPTFSKKKVYILDEIHQLSSTAFNALLKIIEEPPAHVIFIFCTTIPEKLPETVRSRCMHFVFHKLTYTDIHKFLQYVCEQESLVYNDDALQILSQHADNSLRDALVNLEGIQDDITVETVSNLFNLVDYKTLVSFVYNLVSKERNRCLTDLNQFAIVTGDPKPLVRHAAHFIRLMNLYALGGDTDFAQNFSDTRTCDLASKLTARAINEGFGENIRDVLRMLTALKLGSFDDLVQTEVAILDYCYT